MSPAWSAARGWALTAALASLQGCAMKAPVSGFAPLYPELTTSFSMGRSYPTEFLDWTKVDSLQPTLSWEPFPGTHRAWMGAEPEPFIRVDMHSVRAVTYDLKIWTVERRGALRIPAELVYEREELAQPSHRLERPLQPDSEYFWSVRARFNLEGNPRATEWSLSSIPCIPLPPPRNECGRDIARRTGTIPPPNYYRFKTPSQ